MELQSQINTFTNGMNLDLNVSNIPKNQYRYGKNIRLLTNNDGTTTSLTAAEYIRSYFISDEINGDIIGVATGKAYNYENVYTNVAYLLLRKEQSDGTIHNTIAEISNFDNPDATLLYKVVCEGDWNITKEVQMIFNYEDSDLSKLYITDGETELKVINIKDGYERQLTFEDISIFGKCVLAPPELLNIISGSLPVGQIQYCYQLFGKHGIESPLSPLSVKIPVTPNEQRLKDMYGYPADDNIASLMGVRLKIDIYDAAQVYDSIRLYRIQYNSSTDDPIIYLINENQFNNLGDHTTLNITDIGQTSINQLTVEEFNEITLYNFTAQTICKKDNRLFAANIKETVWDVDYDTRAYRCNTSGIVSLESINSNDSISANITDIINGNVIIPENHDCINPLNNELLYPDADSSNNYSYLRVDNGSKFVYGGAGPNVTYYFLQGNLEESNNATVNDNGHVKMAYNILTDSQYTSNNTFVAVTAGISGANVTIDLDYGLKNYGNPEVCAKLLSYQRDEIYRFGAIFYNERGIASPVHWIGDIRFPAADCSVLSTDDSFSFRPFAFSVNRTDSDNSVAGNPELVSRPIGIQFNFSNLPSDVKAVEIVRCRRTESDRTVVTQGALNKLMLWDNYAVDTSSSHEARPFIIPGFTYKHIVGRIGIDEEGNSDSILAVSATAVDNALNLYDFTSTDQCFNKDVEIIRPGDYIVPLYVANSSITSTDRDIDTESPSPFLEYKYELVCNGGIQFQAEERKTNEAYDHNYTGAIITATDIDGMVDNTPLITDGLDPWVWNTKVGTTNWTVPAAVFKYFKFYDKLNATLTNITAPKRVAKLIDAVKIPQNIPNTEAVTNVQDIENKYIDQIGDYTYQNIAMGSWWRVNFDDIHYSEQLRWGIRGITTILQSDQMRLNQGIGSTEANYVGISMSSPMTINDGAYGLSSTLICNIKRRATSQYGGNSYFARANSIYDIHCSYNIPTSSNKVTCNAFSGDTYLGVLDHTHASLWYANDVDSSPQLSGFRGFYQTLYPLESSVNPYLRHDEHLLQTVTPGSNGNGGYANTYFMTEVGINAFGSQSEPMYTYNSAYSNNTGVKTNVPKSIYDENENVFINRIIVSDVKTNNEIIDSWTKFRYADYLDVDNKYGPITNLIEFNGRLFYFQDNGIGIAQVNERSLITDQNNAELVLGTGTVLGRYDYVVLNYGDSKIRDKSIVTTSSTMYWFDYDKDIICAYNNSIIELSKQKYVQSYINNIQKSNKNNVVSLYDNKYNEVWFNINNESLVFNEQLNVFTSFYTHTPQYILSFSDCINSIYNNNIYYIHDYYNINKYNTIENRECELITVINDNYPFTKTYDNVFFDAELSDITTIKSIQFNTKTQQTEAIDYQAIDNREDTYRFFIPREKVSIEDSVKNSISYPARMKGKYLICDYTFDCNEKDIEIPFIKTTYRYSLV